MELDNRPKVTYRGDVTAAVGQMVGPTLAGEWLAIAEATFDPASNTTVARFRFATVADAEALRLSWNEGGPWV